MVAPSCASVRSSLVYAMNVCIRVPDEGKAGADVPAQVGLYVMPNPGCISQIEQDSGGMAGRITRIIRGDGEVEREGLLKEGASDSQSCGNDGDGRELVFVEWALDGLEKGELEASPTPDCPHRPIYLPANVCAQRKTTKSRWIRNAKQVGALDDRENFQCKRQRQSVAGLPTVCSFSGRNRRSQKCGHVACLQEFDRGARYGPTYRPRIC